MSNKVVLIIMDGWGLPQDPEVSAINHAQTPFFDDSLQNRPNIQLHASGLKVGLPEGQMGNSEVGHMNLGAGRIVYQDLVKINQEFEQNHFEKNPVFEELVKYCETENQKLHIVGLLSDGGVHSSLEHLKGIVKALSKTTVKEVYIHAFMDGRDTSPTGGKTYIEELESTLAEYKTGKIASIIGRYFAMDRDKRWERVKKAYNLLVNGEGKHFSTAGEAIKSAYEDDKTDEFVEPSVMVQDGNPLATLQPGNALLFFNFRTDRGRQLTHVLTQEDMPEEEMRTLPLHYVTMTRYDEKFEGIQVLYEKDSVANGLGEQLSKLGKSQIRIAETEKYPHVTFFFNGGREEPMAGESHLLCPSPKVATYDLKPEMSAEDIAAKILPELDKREVDFVCLNFANPDMVGHTGVFEAAVKACETVDHFTKIVAETALENGYKVLITADHGNADKMRNPDGSPHTAHTTSLVPLILMDPNGEFTFQKDIVGKLGDLAPTILTLMRLPIPSEMTGDILVHSK